MTVRGARPCSAVAWPGGGRWGPGPRPRSRPAPAAQSLQRARRDRGRHRRSGRVRHRRSRHRRGRAGGTTTVGGRRLPNPTVPRWREPQSDRVPGRRARRSGRQADRGRGGMAADRGGVGRRRRRGRRAWCGRSRREPTAVVSRCPAGHPDRLQAEGSAVAEGAAPAAAGRLGVGRRGLGGAAGHRSNGAGSRWPARTSPRAGVACPAASAAPRGCLRVVGREHSLPRAPEFPRLRGGRSRESGRMFRQVRLNSPRRDGNRARAEVARAVFDTAAYTPQGRDRVRAAGVRWTRAPRRPREERTAVRGGSGDGRQKAVHE